jgi:hypothetical protein
MLLFVENLQKKTQISAIPQSFHDTNGNAHINSIVY